MVVIVKSIVLVAGARRTAERDRGALLDYQQPTDATTRGAVNSEGPPRPAAEQCARPLKCRRRRASTARVGP
jgi:hypothetical protein